MPSITLTDPVTATTVASGLIATNNANLRNLLNSGLDYVNLKGAPALVSGEVPVWNGTQFDRSSVTRIGPTSLGSGSPSSSNYLRGDGTWAAAVSSDGWTTFSTGLAYGTTDGHTFTATYTGDQTGSVPVGSRIKLTNQAATQYFIVTAHVAGTLTLYGGTTYSITATAITNPFFSREKAPVGFPLDPSVWTEVVTDSSAHSLSTTTFSSTGVSLVVPIGSWDLSFQGTVYSDTAGVYASIALTTTTGSASGSDTELVSDGIIGSTTAFGMPHHRRKNVLLAAKATYLLALRTSGAGATLTLRPVSGTNSATVIRATSAYL